MKISVSIYSQKNKLCIVNIEVFDTFSMTKNPLIDQYFIYNNIRTLAS